MPTKTKTTKPGRTGTRSAAPGRIGDPATRRNEYARPRRGSRRPGVAAHLPLVMDRTAEGIEPRMVVLGGHPLFWDNMARWSITYRCRYNSGHADQESHVRDVIAATRPGAIEQLQRRLVGCGVEVIELLAVRPPLSREEVTAVREANEALAAERTRLGICGEGPERERAIERWLQDSARSDRLDGSDR